MDIPTSPSNPAVVGVFNTREYFKGLVTHGFSEQQAEFLVSSVDNHLATKQDLNEYSVKLAHQIDQLDSRLNNRIDRVENSIAQLELRMTIKLGSMMVGAMAAMTILGKLF